MERGWSAELQRAHTTRVAPEEETLEHATDNIERQVAILNTPPRPRPIGARSPPLKKRISSSLPPALRPGRRAGSPRFSMGHRLPPHTAPLPSDTPQHPQPHLKKISNSASRAVLWLVRWASRSAWATASWKAASTSSPPLPPLCLPPFFRRFLALAASVGSGAGGGRGGGVSASRRPGAACWRHPLPGLPALAGWPAGSRATPGRGAVRTFGVSSRRELRKAEAQQRRHHPGGRHTLAPAHQICHQLHHLHSHATLHIWGVGWGGGG